MKLVIDILATIALLLWPFPLMVSPVLIGSQLRAGTLWTLLIIMFYPAAIFVAYVAFGATYFGMSSLSALAWAGALGTLIALMFGYPRLVFNTINGIANGDGYFVSDAAVYYNGKPVRHALTASFAPLEAGLARYAKDAQRVYHSGHVLAGADPDSFARLNEQAGGASNYWRDKNRVYTDGRALDAADPDSFVALNGLYGSDARHVYHCARMIADADPGSFRLLDPCLSKDRNAVYAFGQRSDVDIDVATFALLAGGGDAPAYCRDQFRVYALFFRSPKSLVAVVGATPDRFTVLGGDYAKDDRHVYYKDTGKNGIDRIEGADAASFELTRYDAANKSDAKDKNRHYLSGKLVG